MADVTAPASPVQVHAQASVSVRAIVLPRVEWEHEVGPTGMPAFRIQKGTWCGYKVRGRAAHDVSIVPLIGCPNCGKLMFIVTEKSVGVLRRWFATSNLPIVHRVDAKGGISPDILCQQGRCDFHRKVYLDRFNNNKPLYAIAYVEGTRGRILIDYTHAVDKREALFHFGVRKNVRVIDAGPAVGFYVDEKTGRVTVD